jgi:hypothetical protein
MPGRRRRDASPLLPLAYFTASYAGMVATFALIAAWSPALVTHFQMPDDVAVTHAATLGWITMAIMGALYQFFPNGLQRPMLSPLLGWLQLPVSVSAWPVMVAGFHTGRSEVLIAGGGLAVTGIGMFVVNIAPGVWRAGPSPTRTYLRTALVTLVAVAALGFTFALNRRFGWFAVTPERLSIHAGLGLVGWLSLTLVGVGYRMMPVHAIRDRAGERFARVVLGLSLLGAIFALSVLAVGTSRAWLVPAGVCLSVVVGLVVVRAVRRFVQLRRPVDEYEAQIAASLMALAGATVLVLLGAAGGFEGAVAFRWPMAAGALTIGGWLGFAVAAQSYKIIPFLVWFIRFRRKSVGGPAPLLSDLYPVAYVRVAAVLLLAGVLLVTGGFLAGDAGILRLGGVLGAGSGGLHVVTLAHSTWRRGSTRHAEAAHPPIQLGNPGSAVRGG